MHQRRLRIALEEVAAPRQALQEQPRTNDRQAKRPRRSADILISSARATIGDKVRQHKQRVDQQGWIGLRVQQRQQRDQPAQRKEPS
jgi:hypothetical protein